MFNSLMSFLFALVFCSSCAQASKNQVSQKATPDPELLEIVVGLQGAWDKNLESSFSKLVSCFQPELERGEKFRLKIQDHKIQVEEGSFERSAELLGCMKSEKLSFKKTLWIWTPFVSPAAEVGKNWRSFGHKASEQRILRKKGS